MDYHQLLTSLLTTIVFACAYAAWRGVQWLYSVAVYRRTVSLTFQSNDTEPWHWLEHWIAKHANQQKPVQHLRVKFGTEVEMTSLPEPILLSFESQSIRVRVSSYAPPGNVSIQRESHTRDTQTVTLWTRGTDSTIFKRLLVAMKSQYNIDNAAYTVIWSPFVGQGYSTWNMDRNIPLRKLNTLTLPSGMIDLALRELTMFLDEKETKMAFYTEHCIPFRRGWLLEGPPGNGKSSFIMAVAAHLRAGIYPVSLSQSDLDDAKLRDLMKGPHDGEPPRVFVLEDIDCLFENREAAVEVGTKSTAPRRSTVTLSGLLNVLDGMGSPINVLIIMTTNYADRLDAALLRPGRVDTRFRVEPPSDAQIGVHYNKFFPDASRLDKDAFVLSCRQKYPCACSMAQVQALILAEHDKE